MSRRALLLSVAVVVGAGGLSACHSPAHHTFVVDVGTDAVDADPGDGTCEATAGGGDCTLRAAVDEANALSGVDPDAAVTIVLATDVTLSVAGRHEDANASGDLDLTTSATLRGDGHTIDGGDIDRVLHLHAGTVTLHEVTVTGGANVGEPVSATRVSGSSGGAVLAASGTTLNVTRSTFVDNQTVAQGLCVANQFNCNDLGREGGGAIRADGTLNIVASTFHANRTGRTATPCEQTPFGPVCVTSWGGAVLAGSATTIRLSTFTENENDVRTWVNFQGGAAVYAPGATIDRSTFVDNVDDGTPGRLDPSQSVTGTTPRGSALVDTRCAAPSVDANWNLVSPGGCPAATPGDTGLGPLADHGGPTATHVPTAASPALDAIPNGTAGLCDGATASDQRGAPRPSNGACDIGAVERQPSDT